MVVKKYLIDQVQIHKVNSILKDSQISFAKSCVSKERVEMSTQA